jgi:tetratricopeptide (TPR) repeat protein
MRDREPASARFREELAEGLKEAAALLSTAGNVDGALELMAYEQEIVPKPPPEFFARLARLYERQADLLGGKVPAPSNKAVDPALQQQKVREACARAGDAYFANALALTVKDDKGYGQALWKGVELYDRAGDLPRLAKALETFIEQRPEDPLTPDALLRLGQAYHAAGLFDKAIAAYRHNQFRYSRSLAATKSAVPLARAYIAKGAGFYTKAEQSLKALVDDNPQITPDAQEFRDALFELADLYYRTGRFELAIARLEEIGQRYPGDERKGQIQFLMADSYRKSALELDAAIRKAKADPKATPATDVGEMSRQRADRLGRARQLYFEVISLWRDASLRTDLERLYLKLAYFYRADCAYDVADYHEAVKLYGEAAFRYQDDPSALAAYIQIVNSNVALGQYEEAKAANERAKWMLRRMPKEAFTRGSDALAMPQAYWEQWLKWSGEVWK